MNSSINSEPVILEGQIVGAKKKPFIEANTREVELGHLKNDCIIPVFSKDNESTISHHEFIGAVQQAARDVFLDQEIGLPEIRVSHVVKGRVPLAVGKPVRDLRPEERTIYYERMMFAFEIPSVHTLVGDQRLNLTIGGVRAYNQENLYSKKTLEKFKLFIGFKNMVCCNMCVSSDGLVESMRVGSTESLWSGAVELLGNYSIQSDFESFERMREYQITERQFAQFVGRCRLYQYLPKAQKKDITPMLLNDTQIGQLAKGYYEDPDFSRNGDGSLSLWQLYNLLTGANKSSYIDVFLSRGLNARELVQMAQDSLENKSAVWYLN